MGLVDSGQAGKVIAWVGTAMFLALGMGGPIGPMLFSGQDFIAVAWLTTLVPLAVLALLSRAPAVAPARNGTVSWEGCKAGLASGYRRRAEQHRLLRDSGVQLPPLRPAELTRFGWHFRPSARRLLLPG
jgi:hypothetical protein